MKLHVGQSVLEVSEVEIREAQRELLEGNLSGWSKRLIDAILSHVCLVLEPRLKEIKERRTTAVQFHKSDAQRVKTGDDLPIEVMDCCEDMANGVACNCHLKATEEQARRHFTLNGIGTRTIESLSAWQDDMWMCRYASGSISYARHAQILSSLSRWDKAAATRDGIMGSLERALERANKPEPDASPAPEQETWRDRSPLL